MKSEYFICPKCNHEILEIKTTNVKFCRCCGLQTYVHKNSYAFNENLDHKLRWITVPDHTLKIWKEIQL